MKKVNCMLMLVGLALCFLPTGVDAGTCKASNGASCTCGAGYLCLASDDNCKCIKLEH